MDSILKIDSEVKMEQELITVENNSNQITTHKRLLSAEELSVVIQSFLKASETVLKSGMVPKGYDTKEKIAIGMYYASELGLPPLMSLRNISVINGVPTVWGDLPLAMVQARGGLEFIDEYFLDKNGNKICEANKNLTQEVDVAICKVKRRGYELKEYFYTTADKLRNPNHKNQAWVFYPTIMMLRKCRSLALKANFADILGGISIGEYDHDEIKIDEKTSVITKKDKTSNLNFLINE